MTGSAAWALPDVVDFEYFLASDSVEGEAERALFKSRIAPRLSAQVPLDRRDVFRRWVDARRGQSQGALLPGEQWRRGESILGSLAWISGLLLGVGLAGGWLGGSGRDPVNAPLFWFATVGPQLLLLVLALSAWLLRRMARQSTHGGGAFQGALQKVIAAAGGILRKLPGERRNELQAALGRMAMKRDDYGALIAAATLALTQRFAIAFNIGLLFAMLALHLPLVDLRFGWQSTYPIDAQQMHRAVHWLATPWRWAVPGGEPTLEQVAATRYGGGRGADTLPAEAARAWWPFLALSVTFYGLLLRAALLLTVNLVQRSKLARLRFDSPEANALWRRLTGGLVVADASEMRLPGVEQGMPAQFVASGPCVALVAHEVAPDDVRLRTAVQRFGASLDAVHRVAIDDRHASAPVLAELAHREPPPALLAVVAPASRDPIVAVALFLRAVVEAGGANAAVALLLTQADEERLAIWRRFMQIQRLRVDVEALE